MAYHTPAIPITLSELTHLLLVFQIGFVYTILGVMQHAAWVPQFIVYSVQHLIFSHVLNVFVKFLSMLLHLQM